MMQPSFDVLSCGKDLESAGLPRLQADVIAKGMMTMVAQQFDSLLTREHFDAYIQRFDQRFEQVDQRFEQVDRRFEQIDRKMDKQFEAIEVRFTSLEALKPIVNLHTWMLGLIIIVLVVPQLQRWFTVV